MRDVSQRIFDHVRLVPRGHKPLFVSFRFQKTFSKMEKETKLEENSSSPILYDVIIITSYIIGEGGKISEVDFFFSNFV